MGLQHYTQDMSKIPIKYSINVLFTQSIHTLRLSVGGRTHGRTDARTDGRMDGRKIFTQYSGISSCSVGSTYCFVQVRWLCRPRWSTHFCLLLIIKQVIMLPSSPPFLLCLAHVTIQHDCFRLQVLLIMAMGMCCRLCGYSLVFEKVSYGYK